MANTYTGRGLAARKMLNRSERLLRLIELDAPEVLIANEFELILSAVREFAQTVTPQGGN